MQRPGLCKNAEKFEATEGGYECFGVTLPRQFDALMRPGAYTSHVKRRSATKYSLPRRCTMVNPRRSNALQAEFCSIWSRIIRKRFQTSAISSQWFLTAAGPLSTTSGADNSDGVTRRRVLIGSTLSKIREHNRGDGGTTCLGEHICHTAQYLCGDSDFYALKCSCIEWPLSMLQDQIQLVLDCASGGRMQACKQSICILSPTNSSGNFRGNYFIFVPLYSARSAQPLWKRDDGACEMILNE